MKFGFATCVPRRRLTVLSRCWLCAPPFRPASGAVRDWGISSLRWNCPSRSRAWTSAAPCAEHQAWVAFHDVQASEKMPLAA
jgi:hypothetical protein